MPWLGDLDNKILWPDFAAHWGNVGPAGTVEPFTTMGPFWIPTLIPLCSCCPVLR